MQTVFAHIIASDDQQTFRGKGDWIIGHLKKVESEIKSYVSQAKSSITLDMTAVTTMDSAGALMLEKFLRLSKKKNKEVHLTGLSDRYQSLLKIIDSEIDQTYRFPTSHYLPNPLVAFGKWLTRKFLIIISLLSFVGEVIESIFHCMRHPKLISWRAVLAVFHNNCYKAMPIVALLNFLIGIVMAYQMGLELKTFGMDMLIIQLSGMIMLREFAPLMTAIIAAGRTSTSFTAQVGSMIVNEEVDALKTMGVSPVDILVIPKFIGLLIALPLLVIWADVFAMFGSMLVAKMAMGITFSTFIERFQQISPIRDLMIGLLKTPLFTMVITFIGCFQGFSVERSSDSIGEKTTQSAVQSLFLIIIINSLFSIIFNWQNV